MRLLAAALIGLIPACQKDETVAGYGAAGITWTLIEQNGAPFPARATLVFGEDGRVSGQAPCNRFTFTNDLPYPWFESGPVAATKMACPDLEAEGAFLKNLSAMTRVILGEDGNMTMANDEGGEMVFTASE
ncbi:META domain-containing protein [uncultured Tateyamaria sp.]|uniref:META domain-containing protein n=1 Tax=uncultured Tateyamaria sp. TaxID=455651 RepID=UPI002621351E|nr:META domain-containing protein [uncultured Tateyamaria sp.]